MFWENAIKIQSTQSWGIYMLHCIEYQQHIEKNTMQKYGTEYEEKITKSAILRKLK